MTYCYSGAKYALYGLKPKPNGHFVHLIYSVVAVNALFWTNIN